MPRTRRMITTLAELFPDEDYRFTLRFGRGEPAAFFASTDQNIELLAQRKHWLRTETDTCAALLPEGAPLLAEASELAGKWNGFTPPASASPRESCLALGEFWEPDFLLLARGTDGEILLCGGCLCFPSSWRLTDKIGKPIEFIHEPVPELNGSLGAGIHKFLTGLKPGIASLRHNWGLSRSPELNQHPDRKLPRLGARVRLDEVWLRVERQALVALPKSDGILFGIRIANRPLAAVKADAAASVRLQRALETMPEAMAVYKGIAPARGRLLELLRD